MPVTVSALTPLGSISNANVVTAAFTLDSSYDAGGEVITPAQLGLTRIDGILAGNAANASAANQVSVVGRNDAGTWKLAAAGDRAAAALSPLSQTNATENLSAYSGFLLAWGI